MGEQFSRSIKRRDNVFGEAVVKRSGGPSRLPRVEGPRWVALVILLFIFSLLGSARLIDLQLIRGSYFKALSDGNRIRRIPVRAPRGEIVDRKGKSLARNIPTYKLAEFSSGGVVTKTEDIDRDSALRLQASDSQDKTRLLIDIKREYPLGPAAAHLVGYVNETLQGEIGNTPKGCSDLPAYILGDLVGRMGIEAEYECQLRGVDGEELVEVDTHGRLIRRLGRKDPIPGKTLVLSIDQDMQKEAYDSLTNAPSLTKSVGGVAYEGGDVARGAFIAQDPTNGEILALVSAPSFDPATLSQNYAQVSQDKNLPLFNRAIGGSYHPGSTFKLVTSLSGLEEGKIDREFTYRDEGIIRVGTFSYSNWYFTQYGRTEGEVGVVRALARSTDTFFYKVGEFVGADSLSYWADKMGFGRKTGIDLPGEVAGLVPSPDWKLKTKGERWFLGNTYHMAIGQGDVAATPLQVLQMTSVVASRGRLCRPHVVVADDKVEPCQDIVFKPDTLDLIREGMVGACAVGGTAFPFFEFSPRVACKTGTAQTIGEKTHAWFTVFGPVSNVANTAATASAQEAYDIFKNKPVVATALLEDGGEGSRVAAPIVRQVLQKWFSK